MIIAKENSAIHGVKFGTFLASGALRSTLFLNNVSYGIGASAGLDV